MSFRKRNTIVGTPASPSLRGRDRVVAPGVRSSPNDGRPTTSTGTFSLDQLLAGHAGLPLGASLLVEETGTTDFSGLLLRYFGAEGMVQGHYVHILGCGDSWRRELPGLSIETLQNPSNDGTVDNQMKIAWRYQVLNNKFTSTQLTLETLDRTTTFCHNFDLTRRLEDSVVHGKLLSTYEPDPDKSTEQPFRQFLKKILADLKSSTANSVHRIVIPSLLSPALYASSIYCPHEVFQFLHSLRVLLRLFPSRIAVFATLPTSLFSRSTGFIRRIELYFDGVIEVLPFQHRSHFRKGSEAESRAQGLIRIHSLPGFHEKGGGLGGSWVTEDMSFKLNATSGFVILPLSMSPITMEETSLSEMSRDTDNVKLNAFEF